MKKCIDSALEARMREAVDCCEPYIHLCKETYKNIQSIEGIRNLVSSAAPAVQHFFCIDKKTCIR